MGHEKGAKFPNLESSSLGRFPLVLPSFWTSDHLSGSYAFLLTGTAGLTIGEIKSPVTVAAGHVYHTAVVFPLVLVVAEPGPVSDAVIAAPEEFELCADGDAEGVEPSSRAVCHRRF